VTVEVHDQYGNLVSTYQDDVELNASGSATGDGIVNIVDGTGSLDISDQVAETVTLTLNDTQETGLDASSTQDVVFAAGFLDYIDVTPTSGTLNISEYKDFDAEGYDQYDNPKSGLVFTWYSNNTYVGTIGSDGNFTAQHEGIAYINATNGSVASGAVKITVNGPLSHNDTTADVEFTVTSGDVTVTGNFSVDGWVDATAIGDPEGNANCIIGSGVIQIKGAIINVSDSILAEMGNGTLTLTICYNATTDTALEGIDLGTIAIWKFNETSGEWEKLSGTTSGNCVSVTLDHICLFALAGNPTAPPADNGGNGGGGGGGNGGTYPPNWGEPAPTSAATPAPTSAAPEPTEA
ncbi:MAG: Ig-like domain-containing protein, partial [Phycisphaerae bacterium]|nr:Ig-like domain-containing protein [Phycisphaerae bacterium]